MKHVISRNKKTVVLTLTILMALSLPLIMAEALQLDGSTRTPNQPFVIMGTVYDVDGDTPLSGVTVVGTLKDSDGNGHERLEYVSNDNGHYSLTFAFWLPNAGDEVEITASQGSMSYSGTVEVGAGGAPVTHDIEMEGGLMSIMTLTIVVIALLALALGVVFYLKKKGGGEKSPEAYDGERKRSNE